METENAKVGETSERTLGHALQSVVAQDAVIGNGGNKLLLMHRHSTAVHDVWMSWYFSVALFQ